MKDTRLQVVWERARCIKFPCIGVYLGFGQSWLLKLGLSKHRQIKSSNSTWHWLSEVRFSYWENNTDRLKVLILLDIGCLKPDADTAVSTSQLGDQVVLKSQFRDSLEPDAENSTIEKRLASTQGGGVISIDYTLEVWPGFIGWSIHSRNWI